MNAKEFLENFGHIANAPNGVHCLHELILFLGTNGKLGLESNNDSSVEALLKGITQIQEQEYSARELKELRPLPKPVKLGTNHFEVCIGQVIRIISGQHLKRNQYNENKKGIPYITGPAEFGSKYPAPTKWTTVRRAVAINNDILLTVKGSGVGKTNICNFPELSISRQLMALRSMGNIESNYIWLCINAARSIFQSKKMGIAIPGIGRKDVLSLRIQLPPIEEQKRIVAKVDELMALCDKLEVQQQERERRFPVLSRASHARFVESSTLDSLKSIFDKIGAVSTDDLSKTILDLAIRGKLVKQNANDEPAYELLRKVQIEKQKLISSGILKKDRTQIIKDWESPFDLPMGWQWVELKDIFISITDGDHQPPPKSPSGIPFLVISDIKGGILNFVNTRHVPEEYFNLLDLTKKPKSGDILYTLVGSFGIPVLLSDNPPFCVQRHIAILKPSRNVSGEFIAKILSGSFVFDQASAIATGIAQKTVPLRGLRRFKIPLPPIAEQYRIVAKLNELFVLVKRLERQLSEKSEVAGAFAQAAVATITGTKIKEQQKMKAPKTELVTKLRVESKPRPTDKSPLANLITKNKGELSAKLLWQQSGLAIDAFYQQLKIEMANGWISEPEKAFVQEVENV